MWFLSHLGWGFKTCNTGLSFYHAVNFSYCSVLSVNYVAIYYPHSFWCVFGYTYTKCTWILLKKLIVFLLDLRFLLKISVQLFTLNCFSCFRGPVLWLCSSSQPHSSSSMPLLQPNSRTLVSASVCNSRSLIGMISHTMEVHWPDKWPAAIMSENSFNS